ncbi:hypothetical protein MKW94_023129 [Papaver nudicaule]|uniref:F-box associated beta-propeller type 1 domain-containing protein n=1 Tax=Papaver nudicaule TaxID=74823 RepID=A0AA41RXU1_PAPNU|nr:hypothetical protein [Papaver nudicaule]
MKHSIENNQYSLMLKEGCNLYSMDLNQTLESNKALQIDYPFDSSKGEIAMWGSCNGLVCFSINPYKDSHVMYIWNPSTVQYKKIPVAPIKGPPLVTATDEIFPGVTINIAYGFGYDSKIDDYKLIRMVDFPVEHRCEVRIYTLGTNSWTDASFLHYRLTHPSIAGVLSNEAIHWIATPDGTQGDLVIVSYDIRNDTFQQVVGPNSLSTELALSICGFDGFLCLLGNTHDVQIEVWVMKEYGVTESWTKIVTISQPEVILSFLYVRPIKWFKNGQILLEKDQTSLALYDPKSHKAIDLEVDGVSEWLEAEIFLKSLVPVTSDTDIAAQKQTEDATKNMDKGEKEQKKKNTNNNNSKKKKQRTKGGVLFYGML